MSADIHALEIEFAKNPTLDACIPLCQAYLEQQRYMEAMVVCKKGMKSAPGDPRGGQMLAEVYISQGKMPKANQELQKLLAAHPNNARGMELMGRVLVEQGDKAGAIAQLQAAVQLDPSLTAAPALLQQLGAAVPAPQAPAPAAPVAAPAAAPAAAQPPAMPPQAAPHAAPQPAPQAATMPAAAQFAPQSSPPQAAAPQAVAPPAQPPEAAAPQAAAPHAAAPQAAPPQPAAPPPGGDSPLDVSGTWADPSGGKKLEHVNDFFAPDTLGFSNDGSHIETAGPGRLTILGFVPKSTGSIKTTILALVAMFVVAGGFVGYQVWQADIIKEKNRLFGEVRDMISDDKYYRYNDALTQIAAIKELDSSDALALGAEAYIYAVLAMDHAEAGALEKAKAILPEAQAAASEENKFTVAASAIVAFMEERYDEGIADLAGILDRGGNDVLLQLENYRLRAQTEPDDDETKKAFAQLVALKSGEPRALNYLGWHYYNDENYAQADANFDQALKNSKDNTRSLIGVTLVDLDRGIGLEERQKELEKNIKKMFALPDDERSVRDLALSHFARAQLLQWQGKTDEAKKDYERAYEIDPGNPLFDYRRGLQLLKQGDAKDAVEYLKKAAAKDSQNVDVIKKLIEAQIAARDYDAAMSSLKRAQELAADDKSLLLLEAELLAGQRQYSEAREIYEKITTKDGGNTYARAQIGISSSYREAGDGAKAVTFMQDAMGEVPGSVGKRTEAMMWEELGRGLEATRVKDGAQTAYQQCIDTYNQYADCYCRLASLLGRGSEAVQAAKSCQRVDPRGQLLSSVERLLR